jgi:hypothetical protein
MLNHEMLKIIQESHPSPETRTKLKQLEHQYDYAMKSYEMIITHQVSMYEHWLQKTPSDENKTGRNKFDSEENWE